jgi:polygalacturonase
MSANIKASVDGTQAIIGVGGVDQMTVSNAGVVTANSFVGAISNTNVTATGSTTARTLANRFADVVNVKDFGAVGDGVADDTAAIQAAINTGKSVYFPDGTYIVSSPININSKTRLFGSGTLKKTTVTGTSMLNIASSNVEIDGLTLFGASVDTLIPTTNLADNAITISGTSTPTQFQNIKIQNCTINGVAGFGVRVNYATNVWVLNNNISYCGYAGVLLLSVIHGIVDGNRVNHIDSSAGATNWYGISITRDPTQTTVNSARSTNCVITNNVVSNVSQWTGIDIHAAYKCVVDSNQVYYCKNGMYAQYDDNSATYKQPSENIVFSNNIIEGNAAAADSSLGIASLGLAGMPNLDITIIGNQIINGGGYASNNGGLYITETKNCIASNNIVKNSWRSGFSIGENCDNVVFENNEINGIQPYGSGSNTYYCYFPSTSVTNSVLRNNRFFNNTGVSANTPTYGMFYTAGTYSGLTLDKNRIIDLTTSSFLFNGANSNRYQDFKFILEPTSQYGLLNVTLTNATEATNITIGRNVYGTQVTSTLFYNVNRTTVSNPKIFTCVTGQASLASYVVTAYTADGTTFGVTATIPVTLTVQGICWTE